MTRARPKPVAIPGRIKFIEDKRPDLGLVATLLEECAAVNQWANFGPLYTRLAAEYAEHMNLGPGLALTPCANAGIALEMVARALAAEAGRPRLRWLGSAFSFKNLGRGYFSDMMFLDCDAAGCLDLAALEATPPDAFDGVIVTNPFGLVREFGPYIRFAERTGKKLVIDNAAGLDRSIPPWPWQVFSLHQTKPYGMGEGGLVLSPQEMTGFLRLLINYDRVPGAPEYWINNGKISDISCAFLIARLRSAADWVPRYLEQRQRLHDLFARVQLPSLLPVTGSPPTNVLPILMNRPIDDDRLAGTARRVAVARQYVPLAPRPRAQAIQARILNYPAHPDLALLTDTEVSADIESLLDCLVTDRA